MKIWKGVCVIKGIFVILFFMLILKKNYYNYIWNLNKYSQKNFEPRIDLNFGIEFNFKDSKQPKKFKQKMKSQKMRVLLLVI
jgi:hypothetical protein